jgi:tRNA nucleotidyltransferase (CCA-adding enzyme)
VGEPVTVFPASLPIPAPVVTIARRLEEAGYETWCIGGAVRDHLLGIANSDFDLGTAAPPDAVRNLFRRTVPIGVKHGTVAVLDDRGAQHEVTTFRRDVRTDGRHADVEFGVSLDEDLARRDFTINAIAYHPLRHTWRDPFDGHGDLLARRLVRAVGDPHRRFREDYLRIVRALRFAARFGFTIDDGTWEAARAEVEGVARLSAERVRDEWFKGLETAQIPSRLVDLWERVGARALWLPEVGPRTGGGLGGADVLDRLERRDPVLITAYLSADPEATLRRLRCSNAEIERGRRLGAHRDAWPAVVTDVSVRHWLAEVGEAADDLLTIARGEGWGGELADVAARVRHSHAPLTVADLAIRGRDIVDLGVPEGPDIGVLLDALLDLVLEHPELNTREALLHEITKLTGEIPIPPEVRKRVTDSLRRSEGG